MVNNCGNNGGMKLTSSRGKLSNMECFDRLPKELRAALANSNHNWSAGQAYDATQTKRIGKRKHPRAFVIGKIVENDAKLAAEYYATLEAGERFKS